ncbi:MAG: EAL domain-containing protein [Lachnospiraceae bacterium]|nr:EAL domain-containing protein [Lachnospiraceae bacterium]
MLDYTVNTDDEKIDINGIDYFLNCIDDLIELGEIGLFGACRFNLKNFSLVNDQLGRGSGTRVMRRFLDGLALKIGIDHVLCRLGGDNFVLLFHKASLDELRYYLTGQDIYVSEEETIYVSASAGIYMMPESGIDKHMIMDAITMAAKEAKDAPNKDYIVFYDYELKERDRREKYIHEVFAQALENREFKVYYQPKVNLKDYMMVGAEALCRWVHNGEVISPGEFIPVYEKSQAICKLDFYMLEQVCRDLRRWIDEGKPVVRVSVNLSRRHLRNQKTLNNILEIIDRYDVPHEYIEIELTETTMDQHFDSIKRLVTGLKNNGIASSVDDFGTGYSSLNLLREAPWKVLKIDRSYLPDSKKYDERNQSMLRHLIAIATDMGFECIVEGVETLEQLKLIKRNGCFMAQGFYFDKPLPVEEFEEKLC